MSILVVYGPEDAQFLRRSEAIENGPEQSPRHHVAIEREEGLEEDVVDANHEAETKERGAHHGRQDQDRELDGLRKFVVAVPW